MKSVPLSAVIDEQMLLHVPPQALAGLDGDTIFVSSLIEFGLITTPAAYAVISKKLIALEGERGQLLNFKLAHFGYNVPKETAIWLHEEIVEVMSLRPGPIRVDVWPGMVIFFTETPEFDSNKLRCC